MNKIYTLILALVLTACETPAPYGYNPDAGTGCDPTQPCCDETSNFREYGEPCGSGEVIDGCVSTATNSLRVAACNGHSATCESTGVSERAAFECLEGYDCGGGFTCLWGDGEGGR